MTAYQQLVDDLTTLPPMDRNHQDDLLSNVAEGRLATNDAADRLTHLGYEDVSCAHIDPHRSLRK